MPPIIMAAQTNNELQHLPVPVIREILGMLPNPAQVTRLSCTCKSLLHTICYDCDAYWEHQCIQLGWSDARTSHHAFDWADVQQQLGHQQPGIRWFHYFRHRLVIRKRIRRFLDLYKQFVRRPGRMALLPGAGPQELKAAEDRLGVALPWQLWELQRHHAGQAAAPGVTWADDTRLLGLSELFTSSVMLASQFAHDQAVQDAQQQMQHLQLPAQAHQGYPRAVAAPAGPGELNATVHATPLAVCFASNPGDNRRYLVDLSTGSIMLTRGLTTFVVAPSLIRFLQKLLT